VRNLSLILREEHRLRVFENRVLKIYRPEREEARGRWRKIHNEPNIRMIRSGRVRWV
jgi:hypothetical protein